MDGHQILKFNQIQLSMTLPNDFKDKVREAVLLARKNHGGSDASYSKTLGISASIYSRLKSGEIDQIVTDAKWLEWGRLHEVTMKSKNWRIARTKVYSEIESNLIFCQKYSKSMVFVDDQGIGKSRCSRHIIRSMKNGFYHDCSQTPTKQAFLRGLAQKVGVEHRGKFIDVKENLKYYLNAIEPPILVLDDVGDLEYSATLIIKELWNATEGNCAWYMIGGPGLRSKIESGIANEKNGYAEIFDRFSGEFVKIVPTSPNERIQFYNDLITDVATLNTSENLIPGLVKKCVSVNYQKSLRYLETLILVNNESN